MTDEFFESERRVEITPDMGAEPVHARPCTSGFYCCVHKEDLRLYRLTQDMWMWWAYCPDTRTFFHKAM